MIFRQKSVVLFGKGFSVKIGEWWKGSVSGGEFPDVVGREGAHLGGGILREPSFSKIEETSLVAFC